MHIYKYISERRILLAVSLAFLSLIVATIGMMVAHELRVRNALNRLADAGAMIYYNTEIDDDGNISDKVSPPSGVFVAYPCSSAYVRGITFKREHINDSDIQQLIVFRRLEFVNLSYTSIGEHALIDVLRLPNLRRIDLNGNQLSENVFFALASAPALEEVGLSFSDVTDQDLKVLANSKTLRLVDVSETSITAIGESYLLSSGIMVVNERLAPK